MKAIEITLFVFLLIIFFSCTPKETKITTDDNVNISYTLNGEGDNTILFVHGWCINKSYWSEQVKLLSSKYKVVTIDLPGHGESGKNRTEWTVENYKNDVLKTIDALDLENVILVGHSMGGNIILEAALAEPSKIKGLICVDTFKDIEPEIDIEGFNGFLKSMEEDFTGVVTGFTKGGLFVPQSDSLIVERVIKDILSNNPQMATQVLRDLSNYWANDAASLSKLNLPLVFINSSATPNNTDAWDRHIKNYKVKYIPDVGHYPMIENPKMFNEHLATSVEEIFKIGNN